MTKPHSSPLKPPLSGLAAGALAALLLVLPLAARADSGADRVVRATLGNGLRVVIVRNTLAPVVSTEVNYLVGSNEAPAGFPGMAHAQEHMMFRGSPGLSQAQLAEISAGIGGDFDADTQQTVTQYFFTVPSQDLELALRVEAIRMRGVLDEQADWERERPAIEQEVAQDLSNPQYLMYTDLLEGLFKDTPYAHDALGTRDSFQHTTGAMLKRFHDAWYAPNNAVLVVVGDLDPRATLAQIRRLFGAIPAAKLPPRPEIRLQPVAARTLRRDTDLPYGLAVIAFRMPGYRSPDFAAADLLADALASARGKLYDLVLQGKALKTDFSLDFLPGSGLGFATAAYPRGADGDQLLAQMREVLAGVAAQGVPPDLVAAAKRGERAQAEFAKNSIPGLAQAWSQALALEGRDSPEDDLRAIGRVTPAQVDEAARRYLDPGHAVQMVLTPQASGKAVSARGFGGKESFAPEKAEHVALPDWAQAAVGRVWLPRWTLQPQSTRLPNGIRLIVQPESISDTVSVYGHIRGRPALDVPRGEEGVEALLGQLFSYGSTSLDQARFQQALDDIGASESAGRDFELDVLAPEFERGVELLAQNELHPALPQKDFAIVRRQAAAALAGELQSPGFLMRQAAKAALFPPHDPELRHPTPQSVEALTLEQLRAYYRRVFRPDLTTILVIGKVTPQRAREVIEKYFGAWQAHGPQPPLELPQVPPSRASVAAVPDRSRVQDEAVLAETLELNRFDPDYYALQLGNRVLDGGFFASRLYRDLRKTAGLVYYVGSSFEIGRTRSVYMVRYACDPANVSRARAIIVRDLRAMQTEPADERELRQAKSLALNAIPLSQSSVDAVAAGLLERAGLGLRLDEPRRAARRYASLTAEQVRAAYARWLRADDLAQITQGPAPR
ncbi:MAG TPA: pitrilysin family protein [Burkholderiales bacterium]|nr:pitrilysin family protein [Burkholderiales bacterium]